MLRPNDGVPAARFSLLFSLQLGFFATARTAATRLIDDGGRTKDDRLRMCLGLSILQEGMQGGWNRERKKQRSYHAKEKKGGVYQAFADRIASRSFPPSPDAKARARARTSASRKVFPHHS